MTLNGGYNPQAIAWRIEFELLAVHNDDHEAMSA